MLRRTASNGLGILTLRNPASTAVAIQIWVRVGSADEHEGEFGLAHVHEHMLFKGTEKRAVGRIAAEIEAAGGDINAYTSYDQTVYHVTLSGRFFAEGLDVLADAIQNSAFDEQELGRELEVVVEEIRRGDDAPGRVASKQLFATAYAAHPYSRPVIGSEASVRSFSREGILRFYKRWYTARNIVVVAVGDLDEIGAADAIEAAFAALPPGEVGAPRPVEPAWTGLRFRRETSRFTQTNLFLGFPVPAIDHPDVPALDLVAMVLGQGESSRLHRVLRRERGIVNGVSASAYTPRDAGLFLASANLPAGDATVAFEAMAAELARVTREPCTAAELEKARAVVLSQRVYERESVGGHARKLGFYELLVGGYEAEDRYLAILHALTPEQIREVAARYLRPDCAVVSALVPESGGDGLDPVQAQATLDAAFAKAAPRRTTHAAEPISWTLSSGLQLIVLPDASVPLVAARVLARSGLGHEPEGRVGATRLLAQTLCSGTRQRLPGALAEDVERMAAVLDAGGGRHSIGLRAMTQSVHRERGLDLLLEVLADPRFDPAEIERERQLQLEAIRTESDRPAGRTMRVFMEALYAGHPFGATALGTVASVSAITRDDLVTMHARDLHPSRLVVAVTGDVDPEAVAARFESAFAGAAAPSPTPTIPTVPVLSERRERRETGPGEQAHVVVGYRGIAFNDPARPALDVLTAVLSGQGGRLFFELRDKQSLAYSVSCSSVEGPEQGYVSAYIGCAPDKVPAALTGLREALALLQAERVTPVELDRARRNLVGQWDVAHERRLSRAGTLAVQLAFGSPFRNLTDWADAVLAVTTDDVLGVAQRLLNPAHEILAIFDPTKK